MTPAQNSLKISSTIAMLVLALLPAGCSSVKRAGNGTEGSDSAEVAKIIRVYKEDGTGGSANPTMQPMVVVSVVNEEVRGRKLKNNKFDYPVVVNSAVEQWIDYFTGKGRPHFEKYLQRSRYFIPVISKVLRSHNMPQDLVYLAMIESGFNNVARSHASAVGPWQFIRATGRRYGLAVDYWLDERRDTHKSTLAAIAYLKELYQEFGSWEIAAASYNAGENKLRRAISRYKTRDFWQISRHRFLKPETRHYVPKIMAAAIISKNPELFGFTDPFSDSTPNPTLSDPSELTPKELGEEAPKPSAQPNTLVQGEEAGEDDVAVADEEDEETYASAVEAGGHTLATSSVFMVANPNEQIGEFEVKGPADLFAVARASGLPFSVVKMLNPELLRWCTPPYMKSYRIKLPLSSKDQFLANYNNDTFERKVEFASYKVRSGDNINKIARRFNTHPDPIRELNGMSKKAAYFRVGSEIKIPVPTGYKRVIASLYDEKPIVKKKRSRYRRRHASNRRKYTIRNASSAVRKSRFPTSVRE